MQELVHDKELFRLIAAGDEAAFRRLFHIYVPKLLPTVQHLTKNAAITEDILQEAFLKLWLNRDKLPEIDNPRSWLLKIVYYQCFSYLRRQSIHDKALGVIAERQAPETGMEDEMAFNTLLRVVNEAVQQLPPQAKRIYQLSREKGLKIGEIAEQLNISPNTVKNSLVRSLQSIRQYIERAGHFLPLFIFWLACL